MASLWDRVAAALPKGTYLSTMPHPKRRRRVVVARSKDRPSSGSHSFLGRPNRARLLIGGTWVWAWWDSIEEAAEALGVK